MTEGAGLITGAIKAFLSITQAPCSIEQDCFREVPEYESGPPMARVRVLINHPVKEMNGTLTSACPDELLTWRKWSTD